MGEPSDLDKQLREAQKIVAVIFLYFLALGAVVALLGWWWT